MFPKVLLSVTKDSGTDLHFGSVLSIRSTLDVDLSMGDDVSYN